MKVGIVGSRSRLDKEEVYDLVDSLNKDSIVVSGGCRGVDKWAEERAEERGLKVKIFMPDLTSVKNKIDVINAYYQRNKLIAMESDIIYAFVAEDREGGVENCIKYAKQFGKKIVLK